jgi:hypothetical protein
VVPETGSRPFFYGAKRKKRIRWHRRRNQRDLQKATSDRRITANRSNALRSTGPKTAVGKARAAQNATTHGLLARRLLLPDEDPAKFDASAKALQQEWRPHGAHEQLLVDRLVHTLWRWHRAEQIEVEIFASLRAPMDGESSVPTLGCAFLEGSNGVDVFSKMSRYETALERAYYRLLHELERAQRARRGEMVAPPVAMNVTMNGEDARNS